jgi:hypothetical protein
MKVEFWINGGKKITDKIAELDLDYVPQLNDIIWLGEPDPNMYVVGYRDFALRNGVMVATLLIK